MRFRCIGTSIIVFNEIKSTSVYTCSSTWYKSVVTFLQFIWKYVYCQRTENCVPFLVLHTFPNILDTLVGESGFCANINWQLQQAYLYSQFVSGGSNSNSSRLVVLFSVVYIAQKSLEAAQSWKKKRFKLFMADVKNVESRERFQKYSYLFVQAGARF